MALRTLADTCNDAYTCPRVLDAPDGAEELDGMVIVQGYEITNPTVLAEAAPASGETLGALPRDLLLEAARKLEQEGLFASFTESAFRLETLPQYLVAPEDERFRAFREGRPLPERIPETSPWLARIATSTAAGRRWQRVHVVGQPLTDYLRFELLTDRENVAAGEDVRIADRDRHPELAGLVRDFWLLDGDTDHAVALLMRYDAKGRFSDAERCTDSDVLARCRQQRDLVLRCSVPVADYVAGVGLASARAG